MPSDVGPLRAGAAGAAEVMSFGTIEIRARDSRALMTRFFAS
jgi:hypothetical protein